MSRHLLQRDLPCCSWRLPRRRHALSCSSRPSRRPVVRVASAAADSRPPDWWRGLNKRQLDGPVLPNLGEPPKTEQQALVDRMGEAQYQRYCRMMQQENQQRWDYYRSVALERYNAGQMPGWFDPRWLEIEEAPLNNFWRQQRLDPLQVDTTWLGEGGDGGEGRGGDGGRGGGRGSGGGGGWWREEDPYWPLRDWGEHPMRWWSWGFAGLLALGGLVCYARHGSTESLWWGCGAACLLALGAMAMSDTTDDAPWGHMGVKLAWATSVAVAVKEFCCGWSHQARRYWLLPRQPHLEATGWSAAAMAGMYMVTGMSGFWQVALPTNPGEAFKWPDVGAKQLVWEYWGYGDCAMD